MKYIFLVWALGAGISLSSCNTESTPKNTQDKEEPKVEGVLESSSWSIENADLPTPEMRNAYKSLVLTIDDQLNYSWKWEKKDGTTLDMTGYMYQEKSSETHTSGSGIWKIYVYVTHINGQNLPGGFYGIYAYENENNLLLNVEPDVSNWGAHPTAEGGIGSGEKGMGGVYSFKRN